METGAVAPVVHPRPAAGPGMEIEEGISACSEEQVAGHGPPTIPALFRVQVLTPGDARAGHIPTEKHVRARGLCQGSRL